MFLNTSMEEYGDFRIKTKLVRKSDQKEFELRFRTSPELFSFRHIDDGTELLMEQLDLKEDDVCLDIGCGYGAIGIAMAKLAPQGKVYMVDRDFVAVDYSNKNIRANDITNAEAILSNGFSNLGKIRFDVIVSNLPTHTGKLAMHHIIEGAWDHLKDNGRIYVVTMAFIRHFIKEEFTSTFGNYDKLKQRGKHAVSFAVKTSEESGTAIKKQNLK
jgi:16S rRNA G1207 methylase RsmC